MTTPLGNTPLIEEQTKIFPYLLMAREDGVLHIYVEVITNPPPLKSKLPEKPNSSCLRKLRKNVRHIPILATVPTQNRISVRSPLSGGLRNPANLN